MNEIGCRFGEMIRWYCEIGDQCRVGLAVSIRGGSGGGPQDTARPASVSELFVGEAPGDGSGYRSDFIVWVDPP